MSWTNEPKAASAFSNQAKSASSYDNEDKAGSVVVGELPLDHPIFAGLSFDDEVPGSGGKTLGQLAFDDIIVFMAWQNQAKSA